MTDTDSRKSCLIVFGGWDGHTPKPCAELFADQLSQDGYEVHLRDTLDAYLDQDLLRTLSLIVPIWTMGKITDQQWAGLNQAVQSGVGLAGFHGGMIDAFREQAEYQWMTGAQWVAHPGNIIDRHRVYLEDDGHPITAGLSDFDLLHTEQYYCHHDPGNHVLATTVFDQAHGDPSLYTAHTVMPYAWTKTWGRGRVFGAAWGHTAEDFKIPEAKEIVRRGMHWASR